MPVLQRCSAHKDAVPHKIAQQLRRVRVYLFLQQSSHTPECKSNRKSQIRTTGVKHAVILYKIPASRVEPIGRPALAMLAGVAQFARGADQVHDAAFGDVPRVPTGALRRETEIDLL